MYKKKQCQEQWKMEEQLDPMQSGASVRVQTRNQEKDVQFSS